LRRIRETRVTSGADQELRPVRRRQSGNIGRDLEQHASGFTEIDRAEVLAILLFGRAPGVVADQLLGHLRLLCVVRSTEGDVMHRTASLWCRTFAASWMSTTLPLASPAAVKRIVDPSRATSRKPKTSVRIAAVFCALSSSQGHALEAADRVFGRDVAVAPARLILCIGDTDERERHPVLIVKAGRFRQNASPASDAKFPSR